MASVQCHKPCEKSCQQAKCSTDHQKTTKTETCHNKNNTTHSHEHSLTDKVKELSHKVFNHHEHNGCGPNNGHPTSNCSTTGTAHCGVKTEKKHKTKKTEGQEGHCMPKMLGHMKKKKEHNHGSCSNDSGSSSESESESDNETCKKKN
ncbi:hypothetical protein Pfo_025289 [Paulownia fortunei]|nr:hypothetical protein Pfo_025289 [Paulownia fortunei]